MRNRILIMIAAALAMMPWRMSAQIQDEAADSIEFFATLDSIASIEAFGNTDSLQWEENLRNRLTPIAIAADGAYYNTGFCVWDLTADSLLFQYNANKVMRPASTQKMLTAVTALHILGAGHEFQTKAYYTGQINADGTLMGDIYVVGDFDPMYTMDDLRQLAHAIQDLGIKRVDGHVYGDASMKNDDLFGNGWCWDDIPSTNQPYHCALMLERGKESPQFKHYSKNPLFHPARDFVKTLSAELKRIGIHSTFTDMPDVPYDLKELPKSHAHLFHTTAHTVEQVLQRMMKNSDNYYAEAMFYQVANTVAAKHCSWKNAAVRVNEVLRKAGANPDRGEVADGSGVSLYNYTSPSAQVAMLRFAYQHETIFPYLYNAMPIAGVDGTLASRMKKGSAYNNVHAKTGTVSGCSCLAGYVTASNGHILAFSIMNNGVMKSSIGRALQDRICQALAL